MIRPLVMTFAEHASVNTAGKLTIAGTIDGISFQRRPGLSENDVVNIPLPPIYLVVVIEGSIADGLKHTHGLRIVDDDNETVLEKPDAGPFHFAVNKFGRPMRAQLIFELQGLVVPRPGDYQFEFLVDGNVLTTLPLYVTDTTPAES